MKGIILAGGTGSRLFPLTKVCNKHLLPVYDKPMIYFPIETLKSAGIKDILVITGTYHAGEIFSHLGSGKDFGVNFTYRVQDTAGGLPHAIALAEQFVDGDKFVSINGDNILFDNIKPFVEEFKKGDEESRILLYKGTIEQCKKSGVAVLEGDNVKKVVEKPAEPPSEWISVGVYMYTSDVFKVIPNMKPSARGELEISEIHNTYIKRNSLKASKLEKLWLDAGTIEELAEASKTLEELHLNSKGKQ